MGNSSNHNVGTVNLFNDGLVHLAQHIRHLTTYSKDSTRDSRLRSFRESFAMMTNSTGGSPEFEELLRTAAGATPLYGTTLHTDDVVDSGPVVTVQMTMPQHAEQLESLYRAGQIGTSFWSYLANFRTALSARLTLTGSPSGSVYLRQAVTSTAWKRGY